MHGFHIEHAERPRLGCLMLGWYSTERTASDVLNSKRRFL